MNHPPPILSWHFVYIITLSRTLFLEIRFIKKIFQKRSYKFTDLVLKSHQNLFYCLLTTYFVAISSIFFLFLFYFRRLCLMPMMPRQSTLPCTQARRRNRLQHQRYVAFFIEAFSCWFFLLYTKQQEKNKKWIWWIRCEFSGVLNVTVKHFCCTHQQTGLITYTRYISCVG